MTNQQIIDILRSWNFWNQKRDSGHTRPDYLNQLYKQKTLKEVSVVTGVRRSGKSTLLLQVIQKLIASGTNPQNILYVNFEEPGFDQNLNLNLLLQIHQAYQETFNPQGKIYLFLDEIHLIPAWEKFVRGLYDKNEKIKIYITGSSSQLLSHEYGTTLTGRFLSTHIYPLSFPEYLTFKKIKSAKKEVIRHHLLAYLKFGGFPQIILTPTENNKILLLKEYYSSILEKDIISRFSVRNNKELKEFTLNLLTNNTHLYSGYKAHQNLNISQPTANKYLDYLNQVYLIFNLPFFDYSITRQQKNPYKVYAIDPGVFNAVAFQFSQNLGVLFENLIFLDLKRQGKDIFYWKGKTEVDFLTRQGNQIHTLTNVCWELNEQNQDREVAGLLEAMNKFNLQKAQIITTNHTENLKIDGKTINITNYLDTLVSN